MTWRRVVFASDCVECECCGEPFCLHCSEHYADCECPGPTQDDLYDYQERDGVMLATKKK
jgi:hypothetical protein